MERKAVEILEAHHLMAIATVRPDGWPQATMVSYANEGLLIYFVISRESQKFANIERDPRGSQPVRTTGASSAVLPNRENCLCRNGRRWPIPCSVAASKPRRPGKET